MADCAGMMLLVLPEGILADGDVEQREMMIE